MRGSLPLAAALLLSLYPAANANAQGVPPPPAAPAPKPSYNAVAKIRETAVTLRDFITTPMARSFLVAAEVLPPIESKDILIDRANRKYYSPAQAEALPEADRSKLDKRTLDDNFYYNTRYGTPLAYARPLDLLATANHPSRMRGLEGRRILDFGYGNIGQLRMMAGSYANAVGVDVDPLLVAYYTQHEANIFEAPVTMPRVADIHNGQGPGSVLLVNGQWPADSATVEKVGGGYDLFISKNTLKRGYVHPEREADPRTLIDLGVKDDQFLAKLFEIMNPGGWVMIYNLCPAPAPADKPYIPWADGRCPFSEDAIKAAGFEVIAYDRDDTEAARKMAHLLGWDQGDGAMNLENDLFAWCTMLRKPDGQAKPLANPAPAAKPD